MRRLFGQITREAPGGSAVDGDILIGADEGVAAGKPHQTAAFGSGGQQVLVLAVHQAAHGLSDVIVVDLHGDPVLDIAEPVKTAALFFLGSGVLHFGGRGAGTGRENEGKQAVIVDSLDEGNGLLKFFLGFTGEAHDDIGGRPAVSA